LVSGVGASRRPFFRFKARLSPAFLCRYMSINKWNFYNHLKSSLISDNIYFDRSVAFSKATPPFSKLFKKYKRLAAFSDIGELLSRGSELDKFGSMVEKLHLFPDTRSEFKELSNEFYNHDEMVSFSDLAVSFSAVRTVGIRRFARVKRRKMWQIGGQ